MWNREPIVISNNYRATRFVILSEELAETYIENTKHVAISITSPLPTKEYLDKYGFKPREHILLPENKNRIDSLFLRFDDFSNPNLDSKKIYDESGLLTKVNRLFREEDARLILDFSSKYVDYIKTFVINCQAGISRSAGVGAALAVFYFGNGNDELFFKRFTPNMWVYRTILKIGQEEYTNEKS